MSIIFQVLLTAPALVSPMHSYIYFLKFIKVEVFLKIYRLDWVIGRLGTYKKIERGRGKKLPTNSYSEILLRNDLSTG